VDNAILNVPARLVRAGETCSRSGSLAACLALWFEMHPAQRSCALITVERSIHGKFLLDEDDVEQLIIRLQ
jgi:hypothetical protein